MSTVLVTGGAGYVGSHACKALVADATRARQVLGFAPQFSAIEPIVATAWRWHEGRVRRGAQSDGAGG